MSIKQANRRQLGPAAHWHGVHRTMQALSPGQGQGRRYNTFAAHISDLSGAPPEAFQQLHRHLLLSTNHSSILIWPPTAYLPLQPVLLNNPSLYVQLRCYCQPSLCSVESRITGLVTNFAYKKSNDRRFPQPYIYFHILSPHHSARR